MPVSAAEPDDDQPPTEPAAAEPAPAEPAPAKDAPDEPTLTESAPAEPALAESAPAAPTPAEPAPASPSPAEAAPAEPAAAEPAPVATSANPPDNPPTGPVPVAIPPAAPRSWLRSFGVLIGIGVALVLVVGTTLVVTLVGSALSGAEDRVLAYYQNLSDKDGPGARKLLKDVDDVLFEEEVIGEEDDIDINDYLSESPFWTSSVLKHGYQPPKDVEVVNSVAAPPSGVKTQKAQQYATVTVAYALGDRSATETFGLERTSAGKWTIISAPIDGFVPSGDSFRLDIAGHEKAKSSDSNLCTDPQECEETYGLGRVLAPPGRYDVTITEHPAFEDVKTTLDIAPGLAFHNGTEFTFRALDFQLRDGVLTEIESQVKDTIDECASGSDDLSYDLECPWDSEDPSVDAGHMGEKWEVASYPKIEIVANYLGEGSVRTVKPGKATTPDPWEGGKVITAELVPRGEVIEEDGDVVWSPLWILTRAAVDVTSSPSSAFDAYESAGAAGTGSRIAASVRPAGGAVW